MMRAPFSPQAYWEARLSAHPGLAGVGYLGASPAFAALQYRKRARAILRLLRNVSGTTTPLAGRQVLDAGAGSGYWTATWLAEGAHSVVAADFAASARAQLQERFAGDPRVQVVAADLSDPQLSLGRFDLVSACDVLLHVVDPTSHAQAVATLARQVAPGGLLLLSEPAMSDGMVAGSPDPPHLVRRTMSTYRTLLAGCGLTLVAVAPATIILNEPIAARSRSAFRRWQHVWGLTWRIQRFDRLLWLLAPTLNTVDTLLCRLLRRSPVSQLLLLARQPG